MAIKQCSLWIIEIHNIMLMGKDKFCVGNKISTHHHNTVLLPLVARGNLKVIIKQCSLWIIEIHNIMLMGKDKFCVGNKISTHHHNTVLLPLVARGNFKVIKKYILK
jgi:hypothetical protein